MVVSPWWLVRGDDDGDDQEDDVDSHDDGDDGDDGAGDGIVSLVGGSMVTDGCLPIDSGILLGG